LLHIGQGAVAEVGAASDVVPTAGTPSSKASDLHGGGAGDPLSGVNGNEERAAVEGQNMLSSFVLTFRYWDSEQKACLPIADSS
jgi:hypothetical protein